MILLLAEWRGTGEAWDQKVKRLYSGTRMFQNVIRAVQAKYRRYRTTLYRFLFRRMRQARKRTLLYISNSFLIIKCLEEEWKQRHYQQILGEATAMAEYETKLKQLAKLFQFLFGIAFLSLLVAFVRKQTSTMSLSLALNPLRWLTALAIVAAIMPFTRFYIKSFGSALALLITLLVVGDCVLVLQWVTNPSPLQMAKDANTALFVFSRLLMLTAILVAAISIIYYLARRTLIRQQPTTVIVCCLIRTLRRIECYPNAFNSIVLRSRIIRDLDDCAFAVKHGIPTALRSGSFSNNKWLEDQCSEIAEGFSSLQRWLMSPQSGTSSALLARIRADFILIVEGRWADLERVPPALSSKSHLFGMTIDLGKTVSIALIPIALVVILERLTSAGARWTDYAPAIALIWAVLVLVARLDSMVSTRSLFRDVLELLPWRKAKE